jgi:hypothetical protein
LKGKIIMKTIDNKFEIGEECYTYARENVEVVCPVCKGTKKILYNGYEIPCKQCNTIGKIVCKQTVVVPHKVKIRRIVASILDNVTTIKYKVDSIGEYINIRNRGESSLFKTLEECEQKCKEINQGKSSSTF